MSEIQDLNALTRAPVTINIAGKSMNVNRIRVAQMATVMELVQPMAALLIKREPDTNKPVSNIKVDQIDIPTLLIRHSHSLQCLIAAIQAPGNPGVDEKWVGDLELDDMIVLTTKVIEVNLDFFIQRVLPALSAALGSLNVELHGKFLAGLRASKS